MRLTMLVSYRGISETYNILLLLCSAFLSRSYESHQSPFFNGFLIDPSFPGFPVVPLLSLLLKLEYVCGPSCFRKILLVP